MIGPAPEHNMKRARGITPPNRVSEPPQRTFTTRIADEPTLSTTADRHSRALAHRPALRGDPGPDGGDPRPRAVFRVLPAEERGARDPAVVLHPPARAHAAALRERDVRRRRQHPGAHACHGGTDRARDEPHAGSAPD